MPTQADFERAAALLADAITESGSAARHLGDAHASAAIQGGKVAEVLTMGLEVGRANARQANTLLAEVARLCRWRAEVCGEHARALQLWEVRRSSWLRALASYQSSIESGYVGYHPGPAPIRPQAPYPWVDPR